MADITMCEGKNCPVKDKCYRFTATPSEYRQSYFTNPPIKEGECNMYWGENAENIFKQIKNILE